MFLVMILIIFSPQIILSELLIIKKPTLKSNLSVGKYNLRQDYPIFQQEHLPL